MSRRVVPIVVLALCLPFANGPWSLAPAAWLAPALLVRVLRDRPARRGLLLGYALWLTAWVVQWWSVLRLPLPYFVPAAVVIGGISFLPFVADRLLATRLRGLTATLVLPIVLVATELAFARGPNGTWGSLAYTQAGVPPLAQLAAVGGLAGITFLIAWGAAAANALWEGRRDTGRWAATARPALVWGVAMALVLLGGTARLLGAADRTPMLRVAMVAPTARGTANYEPDSSAALLDTLFAASARAAAAGASLVAWPENAATIPAGTEAALLDRAATVARTTGVPLALAYSVRLDATTRRFANTATLVRADGRVAWRYHKAHPVPGIETRHMRPGAAPPPVAAMATGAGLVRVATAICFDGDFPAFLRPVARAGAGLLLLPSDDWPAVDRLHARMATLHAVQHGVALVRPTINGTSLVADARGRVLARTPNGAPGDGVTLVAVPLVRD